MVGAWVPEHPVVQCLLRHGEYYPPSDPRCPCCGREAESFYRGRDGVLLGCGQCVKRVEYWEVS